ncbi:uncharacterized protein LOC121236759 [Juglans microcarpa x Juglans regia]|uniref:uncharacterized protein LOC121236759 n=1 Tax=Juglans microcarpa x Juglans regia TaxID=2249226 RepID=UPI001B7F4D75|nr:uncharacterized protein LOC121236759 [Juglans microcarpa x Juglans regia]
MSALKRFGIAKSVPKLYFLRSDRRERSMAQHETLGMLEEIESLVSVQLQVVSYKWLSRNYLVSSNSAKRLLQEFVEKHKSGLEVVYTLSGWLKKDSSNYHIRLVSGPKLAEAKQDFDGNCSIQVYSVQACIPKDPAALWNAEFVQAEELFKQHFSTDNCLRDNRFCGIFNSFVKRNVDEIPVSNANQLPKTAGGLGQCKSGIVYKNTMAPRSEQNKVQQSSQKVGLQSPGVVKDVKSESKGTGVHGQDTKISADKEKVPPLPAGKKNVQNGKNPSDAGGSLANFWGRASAKSKPCGLADDNSVIPVIPNPTVTSAEAQICADEAVEIVSSDDDGQDVNFKRASNAEGIRKRRVVFDFSDEDEENEDAVNLASPDIPKVRSSLDQKQSTKILASEKSNLNFDKEIEDKPVVKEGIATNKESNQPLRENSLVINKATEAGTSSKERVQSGIPESDINRKNTPTLAVPNSPKRRKVLKTQIDERGREVTEVIWEGEETGAKKSDSGTTKKRDNSTSDNTISRLPATKKSPAMGNAAPSNPAGKAGNKKAGNLKDPKQGNILSFFKRV